MSFRPLGQGRVEATYSGDRPTGEDNRHEIARTVVFFLREWGETWDDPFEPTGPEDGADMIATGPTGQLRLQITRVPWSTAYWECIGRTGHVASTGGPDAWAAELIEAIRGKREQYPGDVRTRTVLVLDGSRSLYYDLPPTLTSYRSHYLEEARGSGFEDIFLVGAVRFINLLHPPEGPVWFNVA
jgi:hypothetical protein